MIGQKYNNTYFCIKNDGVRISIIVSYHYQWVKDMYVLFILSILQKIN